MSKPGTFQKGDVRINRRGRPKNFDALRTLAKAIANEPAKNRKGEVIMLDGVAQSVVELILRRWAMSNDKTLQMKFIEVAFGSVPLTVEGDEKKPLRVIINR